MKVLIADDDRFSSAYLVEIFEEQEYNVDHTALGQEALDLARLYDYDIIILDLLLPDLDGRKVLRRLRSEKITTPVLVVSGLGDVEHKVDLLTAGADDYVAKPFPAKELLARVSAVVRRNRGHARSAIRVGRLSFDAHRKILTANGVPVRLTKKESSILEMLFFRKETVLTKESILEHVYGGMDNPDVKVIDVFICKIRRKICDVIGGIPYIETVWGHGYKLTDPEIITQKVEHTFGENENAQHTDEFA